MLPDGLTDHRDRRDRRRGRTMVSAAVVVLCGLAAACASGPVREGAAVPPGASPAPSPQPTPHQTAPDATTPRATIPGVATPVPPQPVGPTRRDGPSPVCVEGAGCFEQARRAGSFDAAAVPEASGLAASRRNPGVLWLLDDGPGTGEVWALRTTGGLLGAVRVAGLDALDGEALAVGPCAPGGDERSCVYVGDIGDNRRSRGHIAVHRFEEPDLSAGVPGEPVPSVAARLTYPGGRAHDAEALLVDGDGRLLVVTKAPFDAEAGTTGETRLYVAERFGDGVLADRGAVPVPAPALPLHSRLAGNVVTGGDARDGLVLLRTYDQVLGYVAPERGAPLETFPSWPVHELPSALEPQSEAVAWALDGCGYFTAGEQVGDLWFVPCRP